MNTKYGDDQMGFFEADIPSPPNQYPVWFHNGRGKTAVSSLGIIPSFYGLLSYPFHIHYGKKRVKRNSDQGIAFFPIFSSPPVLFLFRPRFSFLTNTYNGVDNQ